MNIAVVTDSSACLTAEDCGRWGIEVAPLHVLHDGQDYRVGVDEMPDDLTGATTAGASPAELRAIYRRVLERDDVDGIVAVHISQQLSGTWVAARNAAKDFDGAVCVIDSESVAMGLGFAAIAAADAAARGEDIDAVEAAAVDAAERSSCLFMVDSLEHLRRGGRVGAAAALLGTALSIKPVLHVRDGKLVVRDKQRTGTKARAKLVDAAVDAAGEAKVDVAVHHFAAAERAETLAERLRERISNLGEISVKEADTVLGVHVGPGALGVVVRPYAEETAELSPGSR
ncbi:MAG: DegV family protein [Rhodococcus sp.]|nr:DegV family protein [Rhodococcus sp. (in: high G+C Gram-positive bacteria)]